MLYTDSGKPITVTIIPMMLAHRSASSSPALTSSTPTTVQAIPAVGQPPIAGLAGGLLLGVVAIRLLAHGRPALAADGSRAVY